MRVILTFTQPLDEEGNRSLDYENVISWELHGGFLMLYLEGETVAIAADEVRQINAIGNGEPEP